MAQTAVFPPPEKCCPNHEKGKICMVCKDCDMQMVCLTCIATTHQGHSFIELKDLVEIKKETFKVLVTDIKDKKDTLETCLQKTRAVSEINSSNSNTIKSQLSEKAETVKQKIEKWLTECHERCDKVYSENCEIIDETEKKLTEQSNFLSAMITKLEIALESTSYEEVTSLENELSSQTHDLIIPTVPIIQELSFGTSSDIDMKTALESILTVEVDFDLQRKVTIKEDFKDEPSMQIGDFDGTPVTIKKFKKIKSLSKVDFLNEARIMRHLQHNHVIQFHGVIKANKEIAFVMEDMSNGFLLDFLRARREAIPMTLLLEFSSQIASGMEYVASKRIIHRDLACRNILMFSNTRVKVAHFLLSVELPENSEQWSGETVVSFKWMAIDAYNTWIFTRASDVWSFGVLVWEMMSRGKMPYEGMLNPECLSKIDEGYRLPKPPLCSDSVYDVLQKCWNKNPHQRPTFKELVGIFNEFIHSTTSEETTATKADVKGTPSAQPLDAKKEVAMKKKNLFQKILK